MDKRVILFVCMLFVIECRSQEIDIKQNYSDSEAFSISLLNAFDPLYPPFAEAPIFLIKMLNVGSYLAATQVNYTEADINNMQTSFKKFKTEYGELVKMVPELKKYFHLDQIIELETALSSNDREKIFLGFEKLHTVCSNCHEIFMTPVQHKFAWGNFSSLKVTDPISKIEDSYSKFMHNMTYSFDAMSTNFKEGQVEISRRHFKEFKDRFDTLGETCTECHDSERKYYVDNEINFLINSIAEEIIKETPDIEKTTKLVNAIGFESCYKCHLVHTPASFSQAKLKKLLKGKEIR